MKKILLGFVLILVLSIVSLGCGKVTGGGSVLEADRGERIVFSFNANPIEEYENRVDLKGVLQLNDVENGIRVHGKSSPDDINFRYCFGDNSFRADEVTVNGEEGYWLYVEYYGDPWFGYYIWLYEYPGSQVYNWWVLEQDINEKIKFHK